MSDRSGGPGDVRMKGFAQRARVEEAFAWIDGVVRCASSESVPLAEASTRVLSEPITAPRDVPPFDRSAMDGYALHADETTGASDYNPLAFRVVGAALPARPYAGSLGSGEAVRIMTGAPIPAGADAVVPVEYAREDNASVEVTQAVPALKHIGRVGEDIARGTQVLEAGRRLRPQDIGVIASLGADCVSVIRRPTVRILTTGNELAVPGESLGVGQIYDANTDMLRGLASRDGGLVTDSVRVADSEEAIASVLRRADVDVVLVGGGSSVGAEDHAPRVLAAAGDLPIHGVAMRPSSPAGMGRIGDQLVFLLPGNPVSCLCAYDFFAGRALRLLGGRPAGWPYPAVDAVLTRKVASAVGRVDYCRVALSGDDCTPLAISGASILSSTTRADGFLVVPAASEGCAPGTRVTVFRYDSPSDVTLPL